MRRAAQQFGYVRLRSNDPPCTVTARLSDTRPNVDSGYGGWTEVARPRKAPLAVWVGSTALRVSIPLLLDGWVTGQSVEPEIAQLERMATATSSDGTPPRVRFTAKGAAVPHQNRLWVIDNLAWGDALMNANGNRVRQQVTVSLLEYVADVPVQADSAATRQRAKASAAKSQSGASQKRVVAGRGRSTSRTCRRSSRRRWPWSRSRKRRRGSETTCCRSRRASSATPTGGSRSRS